MARRPEKFKNKAIILGVPIDDQPLSYFVEKIKQAISNNKQFKIYTPNPEICLRAEKDEDFRHVLETADFNMPDGYGLKLGAKILGETLENRACGSDLAKEVLSTFKNISIYIVLRDDSLSTKADLDKLFKNSYPNINYKIGTVKKDNPFNCDKVLNEINDFKPQIAFVCLGAPNQETWIAKFLPFLPDVNAAIGVGGSFDFLTGKIKRAPELLRKSGLEWAFRLYQEPQRLARIKNAVADFLLKCHEWKKRIQEQYRENVLGVVRNDRGLYLVQKNMRMPNHWQFPQGGVDIGETKGQAVAREVSEEVGTDQKYLKIIKQIPETHHYDWKPYAQLLKGFKGQEQTAFVLEFKGNGNNIDYTDSHEVEDIKWVKKDELLKWIHPTRIIFAKKIMEHL
ncbi:WecB/TagA/CpsF family glycosyltransferase [Candidatus Falkowbacteria bacterium]|jgi:N-acetylglucosaminyldiphosphoundecaprenol N-acetyl-beta-D-mannosaminyltransferase|nr:WecB/TagA/CpsF family glycosyltransferase [Candidatus Falkowbacteria bacterium]MBT7007553.1 WecB/TagA/CpsF family glycosyltransferase [Candidatus Falkowbacteria bacterium]